MIALDLEASLIDNAMMGNPRPGLFSFLEFCIEHFDRISLLTTVDEDDAREVIHDLIDAGKIPGEFANVEYIDWQGEHKDLRYAKNASPDQILFLDDDRGWVHPEQLDRWIPILPWTSGDDSELEKTKLLILDRLR